jgi:hypothetical protein
LHEKRSLRPNNKQDDGARLFGAINSNDMDEQGFNWHLQNQNNEDVCPGSTKAAIPARFLLKQVIRPTQTPLCVVMHLTHSRHRSFGGAMG